MVGTGETHSVKEFVELAFARVDLDWREYVVQDPHFLRLAEVDSLRAAPDKAKRDLGWEPQVSFAGLVQMMVQSDMDRLQQAAKSA